MSDNNNICYCCWHLLMDFSPSNWDSPGSWYDDWFSRTLNIWILFKSAVLVDPSWHHTVRKRGTLVWLPEGRGPPSSPLGFQWHLGEGEGYIITAGQGWDFRFPTDREKKGKRNVSSYNMWPTEGLLRYRGHEDPKVSWLMFY